MFGCEGVIATGATMDTDAAIDVESSSTVGINQLRGSGPFPREASRKRVGIDPAAGAEKVVSVGGDANSGDREQCVGEAVTRQGVIHYSRVEGKVCRSSVRPGRGHPGWPDLVRYLSRKQVCLRIDVSRLIVLPKGGCA